MGGLLSSCTRKTGGHEVKSEPLHEEKKEEEPVDKGSYSLIQLQSQSQGPLRFKDFEQDMWGVFCLIAVEDVGRILSGKFECRSLLRLTFGCTGMFVNLWLQITILYYVNKYIVGQAIYDTQDHYKQYHAEVFDPDGGFNDSKWKVWTGPYMELCNLAMSKVHFSTAILYMWIATMLGELRSIDRLSRDIWNIAPLGDKSYEDMVVDKREAEGEEQHYYLIALSRSARCFIYITVIIPKLLIVLALTFIGCRWLCATESYSDLILNALALEFVIGVDEIVYINFAPQVLTEWLESAKIAHVQSAYMGNPDSDAIWAYIKTITIMASCYVFSYLYLNDLQQVIPAFGHDIHDHCGGWFDKYYTPFCHFGDKDAIADCFPFGKSEL